MSTPSPPKPWETGTSSVRSFNARPQPSLMPNATNIAALPDSSASSTSLPPTNNPVATAAIASAFNGTDPALSSPASQALTDPQTGLVTGNNALTANGLSNGMNSSMMSPYGSRVGNYGNSYGYGGMGMGGPGAMMGNPMGMNPLYANPFMKGGMGMIQNMEQSVQTFGRISQLLHMNFDALFMIFSSGVRLIENSFILKHEMMGVAQTFTGLNVAHYLYNKVRRIWAKLTGKDMDLVEAWEAKKIVKGPPIMGPDGKLIENVVHEKPALGFFGHMPLFLTIAIGWSLVRFIWRKLFPPAPEPTPEQLEQQQQQQAQQQQQQAQQPVLGPDGQPMRGPDGQIITAATQAGMMNSQQMMNSGYGGMGMGSMGMGMGMGGGYGSSMYGGGYGGGMGSSMYGSSMYGSGYGSYGSSMYGSGMGYGSNMGYGGYGSSYGYGSSPYSSYSSYGSMY